MCRAIKDICLGEIYQYSQIKNTKPTFRQYHRILSGKTAALFASGMYASATLAKLPDKVCKDFFLIGYNMGLAFQIVDDCLDYEVTQQQLKKKTGADIQAGYVTLPLLLTLSQNPELLNIYDQPLSKKETDNIIRLVRNTGLKEARAIGARYYQKAQNRIFVLPDYPEKQALSEMLDFLYYRTN
jgi:heptaprenyl diphosphate synthase